MITTLAELRAEFAPKALEPDTRFLLCAADALVLIDRAVESGATLAGVEGYEIKNGWPGSALFGFSTDRADVDLNHDEFVELTKNVIRKSQPHDIRFEVVFEGEHA